MTDISRGASAVLLAEWRLYAGGPYDAVTSVTITITPIAGGAPVLATTATGVATPSTGINTYTWTPSAALPVGHYLVTWAGLDSDLEVVQATEIVAVLAGGALGGPYSTRAKLKARMGIPDATTRQDEDVDDALLSASDAINQYCGRQFGQDTVASERTFTGGPSGVDTDDFWTTDDLLIGDTAYLPTTYFLEPVNGMHNGVIGWPYQRIGYAWSWLYAPLFSGLSIVVTAKWGWAQIPHGVESACLLLAADDLKSKDAPFGVAGFGDYVVRVRANPKAKEKLDPYVRDRVMVAS